MPDIFCELVDRWRNEGKIIFENKHTYSIFSVTPVTPGHALVIPKRHVESMEDLLSEELYHLVDAIPATLASVRTIYDTNPEKIIDFYEALKRNPPTPTSVQYAEKMLRHRHLRVRPEYSYNTGTNVGGYAGQMVDHFHIHLFPRREKGPGIVTAMESILR